MATPTSTKAITIDPYSSTTGAGTLSYYANKYGTTVQNLQTLNPTITNPDLIQKGGSLNVPTFSQPAVVTSQAGNNAVTKANETINANSAPANTNTQLYTGGSAINDGKAPIGYRDSTGKVTYYSNTDTGTPTTTDKTATPSSDTSGVDAQVQQINDSTEIYKKTIQDRLESAKANMDSATQRMIDEINRKFDTRVEEQKKINAGYLGSTRVAGIMSGRDRYASELNDQIMSNEVDAGTKRLTDLEAERKSLISQAQQARDEKSYAAMVEADNKIEQNRKDKRQAVQDLYKNVIDFENLSLNRSKEQRQIVSDSLANFKSMAEGKAGDFVDYFDTNNLSKADEAKMIEEYAASVGMPPEFISSAIQKIRQSESSGNPQGYNTMVKKFGYTGTPIEYMKTVKNATKILNGTSPAISHSMARQFQLPEALIGKDQKEIILDTLTSVPPEWFKISQVQSGNMPADYTKEELQSNWNSFRNSNDMLVFKNMLDTNRAGKDNIASDGSDDAY